jgi:hypothetical protein
MKTELKTEFSAPALRAFAKVMGPTQAMRITIDGEPWIMLRESMWKKIASGEFTVSLEQAYEEDLNTSAST